MNKNNDIFDLTLDKDYILRSKIDILKYLQDQMVKSIQHGCEGYIYEPIYHFECEKKCECGAEKCNTTHSDWCPKYEENE